MLLQHSMLDAAWIWSQLSLTSYPKTWSPAVARGIFGWYVGRAEEISCGFSFAGDLPSARTRKRAAEFPCRPSGRRQSDRWADASRPSERGSCKYHHVHQPARELRFWSEVCRTFGKKSLFAQLLPAQQNRRLLFNWMECSPNLNIRTQHCVGEGKGTWNCCDYLMGDQIPRSVWPGFR